MEAFNQQAEAQVRQRAFQLWEERGQPEGYETQFWLQAEREVRGEDDGIGATVNACSAKSGGGSDGPR
ncbi:DUF2934 domain-containing protein [Methylobacterium soli]|uniref:DUF2934 domain-containing protein n=1 Tax=Methylobacterium soli TaxID=553447 RepID=A0A6L3SWW0_9HYPH|nr:DUF2934 domain-containing protein [Methylobacterium soli]KAB1078388.1 DUF2934 domain-containing protein [Methylobacterium soli]GJE45804.1 hypothetical protein AEGHOMDF_5004 [Methylobacterium soli]